MRLTLILTVILEFGALAGAATINVPGDYATIQDALGAAVNGDTILVQPGTYTEQINFLGKEVALRSTDGVAATVIDANLLGSAVIFNNGEGNGSIVDGFTITNGNPQGGIRSEWASPTISGCIIEATASGVGIHLHFSPAPVITGCTIRDNPSAGLYATDSGMTITGCTVSGNSSRGGGGIYLTNVPSALIEDCLFTGNTAIGGKGGAIGVPYSSGLIAVGNCLFLDNGTMQNGAHGGAISIWDNTLMDVRNCTFSGNVAGGQGGALYAGHYSSAAIDNCILWGNGPWETYTDYSTLTINYSDVTGGATGTGNINADPLFVDAPGGDLHVTWNSPCRNAGWAPGVSKPFQALVGPIGNSHARLSNVMEIVVE